MREKCRADNMRQVFLHRPRLDNLLIRGLEKPLMIVVAPSGYGKTQLLEKFFENRKEQVVWLSFTKHDNLRAHFWHDFVSSVNLVFPKLAKTMKTIGFPDSNSKFEELLRHLTREIYTDERIVFVADDYDTINNHDIQFFFEKLVEMDIANFCLIVVRNSKVNVNVGFDKFLYISGQELSFTKKETADFLALSGVQCSYENLAQLYIDTEGWPLVLRLFAEQYHKNRHFANDSFSMSIPSITDFFEKEYFSAFSDETKLFLIRVSFFHSFCPELAEILNVDFLEDIIENLKQHPFIRYDKGLGVFKIQKMYHDFLEAKQHILAEEQIMQTHLLAGGHFLEYGMYYHAADSLFKGKDYEKFMQALMNLPRKRISREYCDGILKHIDELPELFSSDNHVIDYVKAFLLLNNMEVEKAWDIFVRLKDKLEPAIGEEEKSLLGETYLALADISVRTGKGDFTLYYKRAYDYLPEGSKVLDKSVLILGNNQAFFLTENQPGAMEKMISEIFRTASYAESVTQGSGSGYAWLYVAEAAYMVYDLEKTERCSAKALQTAFTDEQHDIVCNAYLLLAKVALARGDYDKSEKQISKIINYINALNVTELFELRDCIESWFNIMIGDLDKLPNWIANYHDHFYPQYPIDAGRSGLVYAIYLMAKGSYQDANNVLAQMEELFLQKINWSLCLVAHLSRAVCFFKTGDNENAAGYFDKAYSMAYHNNIIMPFVEFGSVIHPVLDIARNHTEYNFDHEWLDLIYEKTISYEKNFIVFIHEYYKSNQVEVISENNLAAEELEFLEMLAQGRAIDEIQNDYPSVDAKRIVMDVYVKLGAVNKLDAIRIAKSRKYI